MKHLTYTVDESTRYQITVQYEDDRVEHHGMLTYDEMVKRLREFVDAEECLSFRVGVDTSGEVAQ